MGIDASALNPDTLNPDNYKDLNPAGSEALRLMQQPFPWNREVYGLLLDKLFAEGAKTVAIDFVFAGANQGDDDFVAALAKYGDRVVLGSAFQEETSQAGTTRQFYLQPETRLTGATPERIVGYCTLMEDVADGTVRRTRYWNSEFGQLFNDNKGDNIISMAGLGVTKFKPATPLPHGQYFINYTGGENTYSYLPIQEVFMDSSYAGGYAARFQGKLVFVGPIAEVFHDVHQTPFGPVPGVEIHAQIASDLIHGTNLRNAPEWLELALTLLMATLAVIASAKEVHALGLAAVLAGGVALLFGAAQLIFNGAGMLIPMTGPLVAFAGTGLAGLVINFLAEQKERRRVRSVLDRYVSRNVAELVLAESDQFELAQRGQRRQVTVIFSDIRGFTTITESAVPEELVEQLKEYFFEMVNAVFEQEGTLQQYVGDAIMAVWGNTRILDPTVGALQAVHAAFAMREGLQKLNTQWKNVAGRRQFHSGIGVNHGEVIVGSLGHPQRMEFTTIGDGVNTAARLETATKQFGCDILVGKSVEAMTNSQILYRAVGLVRFKGKTQAIEVFTPMCEITTPPPARRHSSHQGVDFYRRADFPNALTSLEAAQTQIGSDDALCAMYLAQCRLHLAEPPPSGWDGSWSLSEK